MVANPQPKTYMTLEEFMTLPESNLPTELINGELIMSPTPIIAHQRLVFKAAKYVEILAGTGEVFIAPMDVHLDKKNVPQPDVFWVSGPDSKCKPGKDGFWYGAPDLVIEVLSSFPGMEIRDRRDKYELYQKHGVREYWLLNTEVVFVEVYPLENGRFMHQGLYEPGETFTSAVLANQTVGVNALFGIKASSD